MNKKLLRFYFLLLITQFVNAQTTVKIKGFVRNPDGEPVVGASVKYETENKSTITDASGNFQLQVSAQNGKLLIESVGYESQRIEIGKYDSVLKIVLPFKAKQLAEVVVNTGYQKISKERSTGSFERIDPALFNRQVSSDVMSRLDGITSGLFVSKNAGTPKYFIRGLSTINANTSPLIVVDDFPYDGDFNNINPNDVESIVVLKDAAAASIWGARSGNGVIVITTKKGKFENAPRLNVNANVTVQQKPDLFYSKAFLPAPQFIDLEKDLFNRGYYNNDLADVYSWPVVSPVVDLLDKARRGEISQAQANEQIEAFKKYDVRNDYQKYLYQNAITQQYSLNLTGGSKVISYLFSAGFDKQLEAVKGDNNDRVTARQSTTFKPLKWLTFQSDIFFSNTSNTSNGISQITPSFQKGVLYPYAKLADKNGMALAVEKDYRLQYIDTTGGGKLLDWTYKPLDEIKNADNRYNNRDILGKLNLTAQIIDDLSFSLNGQLENTISEGKKYYSTQTYLARNLINRFSTITNNSVNRTIPLGGILDNSFGKMNSYSFRGQFNYNKMWKQKHSLSAIAGAEVRQVHYSNQSTRTYGYNSELLNYAKVDYVNEYPLYGNFGYGYIPDNTGFQDIVNRFTSVYANAAYTYRGIYTLSASARKDAANIFGVDANQKGVPLWSFGGAYKLSNESFYHVGWLPYLKVRATYGYNGNMRTDLSSVPVIDFDGSTNRITHLPYAVITTLSNKDLRWEKVNMVNIGVDFGLRNEKLTGTLEYYHKNAKDLLSPSPIDPTLGINNMTYNVANLSGHGIDVKLTTKLIDADFKWSITGIYSYVTNKVTKYLLEYANKGAYVGSGITIKPISGEDPYAIINYRFQGLDHNTGDPIGTLNGKQSTDYYAITSTTDWNDLHVVGSSRAPHFGNLINTVSWKGLSLSFNLNFKAGFYLMKSSVNYDALLNAWVGHQDYNRRWQKPGDELTTNVPSLIYASNSYRDKFYLNSDANVIRGDEIRMQDIRIGYDWINSKSGKMPFKDLQFYLYANNMGIIWRANKEGIDPEYGDIIPNPKSISIGIKAGF